MRLSSVPRGSSASCSMACSVARPPRPWMWASAHTPYVWDAFFAVQRGESTYEREAARVPLLPRLAARMLRE